MAAPTSMTRSKPELVRKQEKKPLAVLSDCIEDVIINLVDDDDDEEEDLAGSTVKETVAQDSKDTSKLPEAAQKLLKSLEFKNPGRRQFDMSTFDPENSEREMRKLRRTFQATSIQQKAKNQAMYNEKGLLLDSNLDLCDCLDKTCPGCFYPCEQCSSTKCGVLCRCNRKWVYNQIENEDGGDIIKFDQVVGKT